MDALQNVFNNREIAIGGWVIMIIIVGLFTKIGRGFLESVLPIVFGRKFVVFYIIFLSFFSLTVLYLYHASFWDLSLLKDTAFWVLFIFVPLFVKTIEDAKDGRFFAKLIKDNLSAIVIIEFILNFWTFNLAVEILAIPIVFLLAVIYAFASREEKTVNLKKFIDGLFVVFGSVVIIFTLYNLIQRPGEILNIKILKEFLLPILLLFMNLPVVYGLALYNTYEQVFVRIKGEPKEHQKIKRQLFRFAGINLTKVTSLRNNLMRATNFSRTAEELKQHLQGFEKYLNTRLGDNYMKRARFYILSCILMIIICLSGIIASNSTVGLKDLMTFNFVLDIAKIKQIVTYVLSTGLAISICFLIYFIGFRKRKYEEISQIKKFALHDLLLSIKYQNRMLQEFPPVEDPQKLFAQYISIIYDIKRECDKAIVTYDNLLTNWELETLKQLQTYTSLLISTIGIDDIECYSAEEFTIFFNDKKTTAIQNEKINIFISDIERDIKKYSDQIKLCMEIFKVST
ncbi:hypothetical protein [Lederbergia galactosidilytica]|uniref:Uncharacterized protein n=1 Tax=Lederbergia galactosidilytica TaxID=217031 RepID=A0A178A5K9_9BACI|nr:hypothetical protein [Lederbergia galactosidilytica]OAK75477.1 hypothetical protein ABB05_01850 [Lederbergia galactosidilytica]